MKWNDFFKDILEKVKEKRLIPDPKGLIGWSCSYIPLEIIEALNFIPIRIIAQTNGEIGDAYLDPNFCPYIKAIMGDMITNKYDYISGYILTNSCDGMKRLFDLLRFHQKSSFAFLLDVPHKVDNSSILFFKEKLKEMISAFEEKFSIRMDENDLIESIQNANQTRRFIRVLFSLQGRGYPPLRHSEIMEIIKYAFDTERLIFNESIKIFIEYLQKQSQIPIHNDKRILITGSLFVTIDIIRLIEELGAEVAFTDLCMGGRVLEDVNLDRDPLLSISRSYLEKFPCARMLATELRCQRLMQEIERNRIKGVIYYTLKFCDPYLFEAPYIIEQLRKKDIPVLLLEVEYSSRVPEAMRTRIQAFLETID